MNSKLNANITVVDWLHGPFAVVVTNLKNPTDEAYPLVVQPPGGFKTKEEAIDFAKSFASRKEPYLGLHFAVTPIWTENSFGAFCSWED